MSILEWLGYGLFTIAVTFFLLAAAGEFGRLMGWRLVEDIPEGHPDQYGAMDIRERGLR